MKFLAVFAGAGLMALGTVGAAGAQPLSGTPNSPFPYAAPHEIQMINGRACRTVYDYRTQSRVPVACVEPVTTASIMHMHPSRRMMAVETTGSVGTAKSGTPNSPFPYAAPHEVQTISGRTCRTVYDYRTQSRVLVECVQ
ncbi:hypothetical protein [Microvirga massiliensis]|uniref:hypothetical protein n=1 Tax=Microvirga massiliensis TaxID=1033741 RepID=UPI00062BE72E|nr:hypothetical protein [Microvirga massiliensis]